jgi:NAD(P)-dependent dehydrogenase (short-subunit alcohol dehydrogenase family)
MKNVEGKVAFITGGASGIGLGMAQAFVGAGMQVVIADLLQAHIEEAKGVFEGSNSVHFIRLDVTDRAAMAAAAEETERLFGKVHVLCNNVGVASRPDIDEATYADWDYVLGVNIGGAVNGVVTFVPRIKAHGEGGHIVTTSSMAGVIPVPGSGGIYTTSKFAVRAMAESLRLTLGPHRIGVSVLAPGMTRTRAMTGGSHYRAAHAGGDDGEASAAPIDYGMDPFEVGQRVLEAIIANRPYVFPHNEFAPEVREYFDEMMAAFPGPQEADEKRMDFERGRASRTAEARRIANAIDT